MKKCCDCKKELSFSNFTKNKYGKFGYSSVCKPCFRIRSLNYRKRKKEERNKMDEILCNRCNVIKHKSEFTPNLLCCIKCAKNTIIKYKFNINIEDYNNMLKQQNYSCAICLRNEKEFNKGLAIDHCHSTGKIRKLLCMNCNTLIGQCNDNIEILKQAIIYLDNFKNSEYK